MISLGRAYSYFFFFIVMLYTEFQSPIIYYSWNMSLIRGWRRGRGAKFFFYWFDPEAVYWILISFYTWNMSTSLCVGGMIWWVACKPILVFSFVQAEQNWLFIINLNWNKGPIKNYIIALCGLGFGLDWWFWWYS